MIVNRGLIDFLYSFIFFGLEEVGNRRVLEVIGSQPPPARCHASHSFSTVYRVCSREALGE